MNTEKENAIYLARIEEGREQYLIDHLKGSALLAKNIGSKFDMPLLGFITAFHHDYGKYGNGFQRYIRECQDENFVADEKIDHSTAGAQHLYKLFNELSNSKGNVTANVLAQIMGMAVACHHGGLIDTIREGDTFDGMSSKNLDDFDEFVVEGTNLTRRMNKHDELCHYQEALENADKDGFDTVFTDVISTSFGDNKLKTDWAVLAREEFETSFFKPLFTGYIQQNITERQFNFYLGLMTRLALSCVVDADRTDTIRFCKPYLKRALLSELSSTPDWGVAISRLEKHLASFDEPSADDIIGQKRQWVSERCLAVSKSAQGNYSLTVPTGGGKTLASLRFALHHAKQHNLDKVVIIAPFVSIIEQNAKVIRDILEPSDSDRGQWVLEHHSDISHIDAVFGKQAYIQHALIDNWNRPVIITTMVQYLNACFAGGTKALRRMHNLTNAVVIFDEPQALSPDNFLLYANSVNFFTRFTKTTMVQCTATQPHFDLLANNQKIKDCGLMDATTEIIGSQEEVDALFDGMERVQVHTDIPKLNNLEAVEFVLSKFYAEGSTLLIVNTRKVAREIARLAKEQIGDGVYLLSTDICPAHRLDILNTIHERLNTKKPTLVISTQVIEAGVDISFRTVIRSLAGLNSIQQALGRCNRHGESKDLANAYLVQLTEEKLTTLPEIMEGQVAMNSLLAVNKDVSLLSAVATKNYAQRYYNSKAIYEKMGYKVAALGDNSIYDLLSQDCFVGYDNAALIAKRKMPRLVQSFRTAAEHYQAIRSCARRLIVPYGEAKTLVLEILSWDGAYEHIDYRKIEQLQRYSVPVYDNTLRQLYENDDITDVPEFGLIFLANDELYSELYGLYIPSI